MTDLFLCIQVNETFLDFVNELLVMKYIYIYTIKQHDFMLDLNLWQAKVLVKKILSLKYINARSNIFVVYSSRTVCQV